MSYKARTMGAGFILAVLFLLSGVVAFAYLQKG